ncbi:Hypothetical_protein [Hexamita inflata]|uniref:Hypothetical_protein n=1 Tax=Hexamita inflata TaxID=28002 RepID=A0AA86TP16_9EUKA|nr:Hypothetical protein HINF_LOCUS9302 [Hexamita inflata]CAI9950191.1 Hypothetical protein HINF_LOCUS37836 [Hexamita inflata]
MNGILQTFNEINERFQLQFQEFTQQNIQEILQDGYIIGRFLLAIQEHTDYESNQLLHLKPRPLIFKMNYQIINQYIKQVGIHQEFNGDYIQVNGLSKEDFELLNQIFDEIYQPQQLQLSGSITQSSDNYKPMINYITSVLDTFQAPSEEVLQNFSQKDQQQLIIFPHQLQEINNTLLLAQNEIIRLNELLAGQKALNEALSQQMNEMESISKLCKNEQMKELMKRVVKAETEKNDAIVRLKLRIKGMYK